MSHKDLKHPHEHEPKPTPEPQPGTVKTLDDPADPPTDPDQGGLDGDGGDRPVKPPHTP